MAMFLPSTHNADSFILNEIKVKAKVKQKAKGKVKFRQ
jgi:hypothetical protein